MITDLAVFQANDSSFDIAFDTVNQCINSVQGMETAVMMQLFTDRRTIESEGISNPRMRGGSLADVITKQNNVELGGKLYLKYQARNTPNDINEVITYANDSLKYFTKQGYAKSVKTLLVGSNIQAIINVSANKSNTYYAIWQATGSQLNT